VVANPITSSYFTERDATNHILEIQKNHLKKKKTLKLGSAQNKQHLHNKFNLNLFIGFQNTNSKCQMTISNILSAITTLVISSFFLTRYNLHGM